MERKNVSRAMALFVAWIGCGLLLPFYIGDGELSSQRLHTIAKWLPWCLIGIGFVAIMIYLICWSLSDMLNCALGTMKYSDGTSVWGK